jgi:catechol 2,3-dioxygenase-like lactoylglutathione lyase family enzyme
VSAVGLDHAGLTVSDLDRAVAFWRDLLGFRELGRGVVRWPHLDRLTGIDETAIAWVGLALEDGTTVELQEYLHPRGRAVDGDAAESSPGRTHLGLAVRDLDALVERLHGARVPLRSPAPVVLEEGAYRGWRAIYCLDPDGHSLELMEPPPDTGT